MQLIELKNVYKKYPNGVNALCDVNLSISKGEFVFVIGHTGCGKSTLIKMLYRAEKPDSGTINVGGVEVTKLRSYPNELSGGEQQRVSIARAIVNEPKVLICDEPTGNLDDRNANEVMKVIENINKELGTTIIMATHSATIVNKMKKRVIEIVKGVVERDEERGKMKRESN